MGLTAELLQAEHTPEVKEAIAKATTFMGVCQSMAEQVEEGLCERCLEPNGWRFLDKEYTHLCGKCAETRDAYYTGSYYRYGAHCSGGCSTIGVINYRQNGEARFYCAGSPRCLP